MIKVKTVIISSLSLLFIISAVLLAADYFTFQKTAEAVGGMPWQDGGTVSVYIPVCVATPPDGVCKNCTMCGPKMGNYVCAGYSEIQLQAQNGTTEVCPVQGFAYSGGGAMPTAGQGIIVGGASNILPWVIGVPGVALSQLQKLAASFNGYLNWF